MHHTQSLKAYFSAFGAAIHARHETFRLLKSSDVENSGWMGFVAKGKKRVMVKQRSVLIYLSV